MIKCVSYNCRGWKSGSHFVNHLLSQCDLCFIQEHWLLNDHLTNLIIDDNFSFTATSGINDSELILGRPYGGCAILFRKKLHPSISCIITNFSRFSALTFSNSSHVTLIICVYLPTDYGTLSSQEQFAETVDELHGFINSINHDSLLVAGDFNVDFTRDSCNSIYLLQLMEELDLVAVDSLSKNINSPMKEMVGELGRGLTMSYHPGLMHIKFLMLKLYTLLTTFPTILLCSLILFSMSRVVL